MLGVPQEDRRKIFDWSNEMMAYDDPTVDGDQATAGDLIRTGGVE